MGNPNGWTATTLMNRGVLQAIAPGDKYITQVADELRLEKKLALSEVTISKMIAWARKEGLVECYSTPGLCKYLRLTEQGKKALKSRKKPHGENLP
jgi:DNA-binding PadR family transcriptional regulator